MTLPCFNQQTDTASIIDDQWTWNQFRTAFNIKPLDSNTWPDFTVPESNQPCRRPVRDEEGGGAKERSNLDKKNRIGYTLARDGCGGG